MNKLLELQAIDVKNRSTYRLKNINLSIFEGEKIALLGKSGSGKSTLISIANGSLKPDKGRVKWKSKDISERRRDELVEIGTLWQDLRLVEELNVQQNINTGALGRKSFFWAIKNIIGDIESEICTSCLMAAGLPKETLKCKVNQISGGQKQRVAIARLIRQQAKLILADEPLSSLDPKLSKDILYALFHRSILYKIKIPKTYLISLHEPKLINEFTRIICLKDGQIIIDVNSDNFNLNDLKMVYQ